MGMVKMKFKIKNIDVLKAKLTKIRDSVGEFAAIKFKEDGIKIMVMNSNGVLASQLFISKENLVGYWYEPIKNIAVNLYALLEVLEEFNVSIEFALNKDSLSLSAGNKTFNLDFMDLESDYEFTEFNPLDYGPLVINSVNNGFELDWIVAPN